MNRSRGFIWAFLAIIVLTIVSALFWFNGVEPSTTDPRTSTGAPGSVPASKDDLIVVDTPLPNSIITSPLTATGKARGGWYFEASFGVKILDANGKMLAIAPAVAQSDWMTPAHVPFKATLTFATPSTPTGYVVFMKENPSDLPQNADELQVPVRFSTTGDTRIKLYFYNYNLDDSMCSPQGLVAAERVITKTITPLKASIELLLQESPREEGLINELPQTGVTLKSATIQNGVATLTFSDPLYQTSGGSCKVSVMRNQIEATAKQFPTVQSVRIVPETAFQP